MDELIRRLATKYQVDETYLSILRMDLQALNKAYGSLENVRGKKVLDLGCGSTNPEEGKRFYEPWFCRSLVELGAQAVGVDQEDLSGEQFLTYRVDLTKPDSLDFLHTQSFDAINCKGLIDSPRFIARRTDRELKEIYKVLGLQVKRLLKLEGAYLNILDSARNDVKLNLGL